MLNLVIELAMLYIDLLLWVAQPAKPQKASQKLDQIKFNILYEDSL